MQMAYGTNPCTYASDDTPNGCDVGGSANDVQEDNSQGLLGESNADIKTIEHNLFVEVSTLIFPGKALNNVRACSFSDSKSTWW